MITSAGIVLAATFAVLGILPLVALAQVGFLVSFGVLLDTLLVRSMLVPAITFDLGKRIWWPSRLSREDVSSSVEPSMCERNVAPSSVILVSCARLKS